MAEPAQEPSKLVGGIKDINQQMKEKDVQAKAKQLGLPYVNLLTVPLNPDLAHVLSVEEAVDARAGLFFQLGKKIRMAVIDPNNEKTKAMIAKLQQDGYELGVSMCSDESLAAAHKIYYTAVYKKEKAAENVVEEADLGSVEDEIADLQSLKEKIEVAKYDQALNYVQVGAYKTKSSDIHFQPEKDFVQVRFRIDGVLQPVFQLKKETYEGIIKEIKYLSHLKLNVTSVPQDGQYSFTINQKQVNVRVSTLPTHYGEATVMRLLDSERARISFEDLGFEGVALQHIKESSDLSHGMILVTGPTGSGKTTTLYTVLQSIDTKTKKVITLEDPIEYNLEGISQSQIAEDKEYDFASGLRAILRQDPDVIMVGEIRDLETAETATQAALTGHLVISTLHTNSAVESIPRLVNMGIKSFILAPAVELIMAQRLVRKINEEEAEMRPITESERAFIAEKLESMKAKGLQAPEIPAQLKHPKEDAKLAYKGQMAITEVLRFDQGLRDQILENKPMPEIYDYIEKNSQMLTLAEDGVLKVIRGLTTLEEVHRVAG